MTVQTTEAIVWDVNDAIVQIASQWLSVQGLTGTTVSYTNAPHNGYRAVDIVVTVTASGDQQIYRTICASLASTETCPGVYIANSAKKFTPQVAYDIISGTPNWPAQLADIENYCGFAIRDILTNWCNGFCTQKPSFEIRSMFNRLSTAAFNIEVLTDALAFVYTVNVSGTTQDAYPDFTGAAIPPTSSPVTVIDGAAGAQLKGMTSALKQIADTDYNISINHGQSIFSVKGKVLT